MELNVKDLILPLALLFIVWNFQWWNILLWIKIEIKQFGMLVCLLQHHRNISLANPCYRLHDCIICGNIHFSANFVARMEVSSW